MIRHCVFIKLDCGTSAAAWFNAMTTVREVGPHVPGMLDVHDGQNVSTEEGMDKGYSHAFVIDFEDAGARDAYLAHPRHKRASEAILSIAEKGAEGIFVFDLPVEHRDRQDE